MKRISLARADRLLVVILLMAALAAALISWVSLPPEKEGGLWRQPSSFFNTSYGTKAAYLVLDELGFRVSRLRRPISPHTLSRYSGLFVLQPIIGLSDDEQRALQNWVRQGRRLVLAPGVGGEEGTCPNCGAFFDEWFNVISHDAPDDKERQEARARFGKELDASEPLCAGIDELVGRCGSRFLVGSPVSERLQNCQAHEFWEDRYGVMALRVEYGAGQIIALADPYPLTNRGLSQADNGLFLANLAQELAGLEGDGIIAFDEFHLGYAERDSSWLAIVKLTLAQHWGWAVGQGLLVGVLALYAAAVRFGRPRDVVLRKRRHHGEFARSAGRLLHDAMATELAYRTLFDHYRNRLCKLVHLPPEADDTALSTAVGRECGLDLAPILSSARQRIVSSRITRTMVFEMAKRMHRTMEELEHGL
ncbi:MAG: DUF4350 domain-containing protein [Phycisphaerae bacterium]|nr:DUF4350 domain-containing protein [Phycisphaerae bacterium]